VLCDQQCLQVEDALYSLVQPTPTGTEPVTVAYSRDVAALLDLDPSECERPEFPMIMSGQAPLPGRSAPASCSDGVVPAEVAAFVACMV
jgi:uncharacterized protein YdiU (UPF0061 family)